MNTLAYIVGAILLVAPSAQKPASKNACGTRIPEVLTGLPSHEHPGYRIAIPIPPRDDETGAQRAVLGQCLSVASGNYDGNGTRDFALVMESVTKRDMILVVALRSQSEWKLVSLPTWCGRSPSRCYVETEERHGPSRRAEEMDEPLLSNERESLVTKTDSVASGVLDSSRIIYALQKGKWRYVWVSE